MKQKNKRYTFKIRSPLVTRILIGLLVLFLLSFFVNLKLVFFLIIAIVFNAWLANFQLKRGLPTDFELSTFTTVLVTASYGLTWGILVAILSKLIASIYTGNILADHFFMMLTYVNAALITFFISGDILVMGLVTVLINNVLMFLISKNILGLDITSNLSYTITNFVFNLVVFLIFAEPMYGFLN